MALSNPIGVVPSFHSIALETRVCERELSLALEKPPPADSLRAENHLEALDARSARR